jgi:hypothetical protein
MLLACALAKAHRPELDIRKPYTEIGSPDAFSGRAEYDEGYISEFARQYRLPVNITTGFLTPGFRVKDAPLTPDLQIVGRPRKMYADVAALLDDVYSGRLTAEDLLAETIRQLLILRQEQDSRLQALKDELATAGYELPLSSEEIVILIEQHLRSPRSSRLPVLIVAAAYQAAQNYLGERTRPLLSHNAADSQTGSLGDVEITLVSDEAVVTSYEMKSREVTIGDVNGALTKVAGANVRPSSYIFITTKPISKEVLEYAASLYREVGTEFAILDCIGFLRHFLHLFHRLRSLFLDAYQELVLKEPESAVNQPLKEAFLTLRRAAEYNSSQSL